MIASAGFVAGIDWKTVRVPFGELKRRAEGGWDGRDVRAVMVELGGAARAGVWVEIDNLRMYRE